MASLRDAPRGMWVRRTHDSAYLFEKFLSRCYYVNSCPAPLVSPAGDTSSTPGSRTGVCMCFLFAEICPYSSLVMFSNCLQFVLRFVTCIPASTTQGGNVLNMRTVPQFDGNRNFSLLLKLSFRGHSLYLHQQILMTIGTILSALSNTLAMEFVIIPACLGEAMVESVACYGNEVWLLKTEEQRKLQALESQSSIFNHPDYQYF